MSIPSKVIVYLWAQDILGAIVGSALNAKFAVTTRQGFNYGNYVIDPSVASASFDSNGFAQLEIVETETPGIELLFSVIFKSAKTTKSINFKPVIVPNAGAINLTSITDIVRGGLS